MNQKVLVACHASDPCVCAHFGRGTSWLQATVLEFRLCSSKQFLNTRNWELLCQSAGSCRNTGTVGQSARHHFSTKCVLIERLYISQCRQPNTPRSSTRIHGPVRVENPMSGRMGRGLVANVSQSQSTHLRSIKMSYSMKFVF